MNNIYLKSMPPHMSDGRNFTDYRSQNIINNILIKKNKLDSSKSVKNFYVKNSLNVIYTLNKFYKKKNFQN